MKNIKALAFSLIIVALCSFKASAFHVHGWITGLGPCSWEYTGEAWVEPGKGLHFKGWVSGPCGGGYISFKQVANTPTPTNNPSDYDWDAYEDETEQDPISNPLNSSEETTLLNEIIAEIPEE